MAAVCADVLWSERYRRADPREEMARFMAFWTRHRDILNAPEERLVARRPEPPVYETLELARQGCPAGMNADVPAPATVARAVKGYHVPLSVSKRRLVIPPGEGPTHTITVAKRIRGLVLLAGVTAPSEAARFPALYEYSDYSEYFLRAVRVKCRARRLYPPRVAGGPPLRRMFTLLDGSSNRAVLS